jgi:hypothetical protein
LTLTDRQCSRSLAASAEKARRALLSRMDYEAQPLSFAFHGCEATGRIRPGEVVQPTILRSRAGSRLWIAEPSGTEGRGSSFTRDMASLHFRAPRRMATAWVLRVTVWVYGRAVSLQAGLRHPAESGRVSRSFRGKEAISKRPGGDFTTQNVYWVPSSQSGITTHSHLPWLLLSIDLLERLLQLGRASVSSSNLQRAG